MKNIQYISASAGSGKTYTLTHRLADLIAKGEARPESVILTTFTKKAAQEFRDKAKAVLYEQGFYDEANRLDQAMIGDVHSVANSFIQKYWYYLDISPTLRVLADTDQSFYISQSLSNLATAEERAFMYKYAEELGIKGDYNNINYNFWTDHLQSVVGFATNYSITDFKKSHDFSMEQAKKIFPGSGHFDFNKEDCRKALQKVIDISSTETTGIAADRAAKCKGYLDNFDGLKSREVCDIAKFMNDLPREFDVDEINDFKSSVPDFWSSDFLLKLVLEYIDKLFAMAERWQKSYLQYKRNKHLIDYNDMEQFLLKLLRKEEVRQDIENTYTHLFVDEFQDSSPIQVSIFNELSDMMKASIWVGDYKQAIYGFRGADTDLVKVVADEIGKKKDGCSTDTLTVSYRSLPDIVNLVNNVFVSAFSSEIPEDKVKLNVSADMQKFQEENHIQSLRCWLASGKNNDKRYQTLAAYVANEVKNGKKPEDIAILAHKHSDLDCLARYLSAYKLPMESEASSVSGFQEVQLLQAILSYLVNPWDSYAKSLIAHWTVDGYSVNKILDEKIASDADKAIFLNQIPLLIAIDKLRPQLAHLSVRSVVETLIVELDLCGVTAHWLNGKDASVIFQAIIDSASAYEDHCRQLFVPATFYGFNDYLSNPKTAPSIPGDPHGIKLLTMHGAKGLEWKTVILLALDEDIADEKSFIKREIFGVHKIAVEPNAIDKIGENVVISVLPPLGGTWSASLPGSVLDAVKKLSYYDAAFKGHENEMKRLMYVAMTRPSQQLVLTLKNGNSPFKWFNLMGICTQSVPSHAASCDIFDCGLSFDVEQIPVVDGWLYEQSPVYYLLKADAPFEGPLRNISPSSTYGSEKGTVTEVLPMAQQTIAVDWNLVDANKMNELGTCIHNIFAAIDQQLTPEFAQKVIDAHQMNGKLKAGAAQTIVDSWIRLNDFLVHNYGKAEAVFHELPFSQSVNNQIVSGDMDYVYKTPDGVVLIDFKNLHIGSLKSALDAESEHYLGNYKGQFTCYKRALEAQGEKVLACYVYLPLTGQVVKIE